MDLTKIVKAMLVNKITYVGQKQIIWHL